MNGLRRLFISALAAGCLAQVCSAQALIEYGAAAAVGTAGSAGGKAVSNALDRIFKKTDKTLQQSEPKQPPATPEQRKKAAAAAAASAGAPAATAGTRRPFRPRIAGPVVSVAEYPSEQPTPAADPRPSQPPPPAITAEEFSQIIPGSTRQELLAQAGPPAYRVRISGDGHVQEIYRYSSGGVDLGSVRVTDGTVTSIRPRRQ